MIFTTIIISSYISVIIYVVHVHNKNQELKKRLDEQERRMNKQFEDILTDLKNLY